MNKFVFTCGDVNGIGPEIVLKTLNKIYKNKGDNFLFICPQNIFEHASAIVKPQFEYAIVNNYKEELTKKVNVISKGNVKQNIGKPTKDSGRAAYKSIKLSGKLAIEKKVNAIITAPISKTAIQLAGYKFPGHTEMYAKWCGVNNFVMMFLSKRMNAALVTIHEPIKNISRLLNKSRLQDTIKTVIKTLKTDLNILNPRIAILGLNPHAGENGIIGHEEKSLIKPLMKNSKFKNYLDGPFSPDAFFANRMYKNYSLVLGMYHDQVLIPFKMMNFGAGVNFTAGLPIVRTSPDHGTAFDIAWKNIASEDSMLKAFSYAKNIVKNRK